MVNSGIINKKEANSLHFSKTPMKTKRIETVKNTNLRHPQGANGFDAEIFACAPKAYFHTSRGSERK